MNIPVNQAGDLPQECVEARNWLRGENPDGCEQAVELHLSECPSCLVFAQRFDTELPSIQVAAAQAENDSITAPNHLRQFIALRIEGQREQVQRKPDWFSFHQIRSPINLLLSSTACLAIAVALWSAWPRDPPDLNRQRTTSLRPSIPPSNNTTDALAVEGVSREQGASVLAEDGYFVAAESTEPGEVPFFWVLPNIDNQVQ